MRNSDISSGTDVDAAHPGLMDSIMASRADAAGPRERNKYPPAVRLREPPMVERDCALGIRVVQYSNATTVADPAWNASILGHSCEAKIMNGIGGSA